MTSTLKRSPVLLPAPSKHGGMVHGGALVPELIDRSEAGFTEETGTPPAPPKLRWWSWALLILLAPGTAAGLFVVGWIPRARQERHLQEQAARVKNAPPLVVAVLPRRAAASAVMQLPGDVQALEETTIYPRTSGYMKKWLVDIGDEVGEGQLLAEIDTPEVDQELRQAEAALHQLQAKKVTAQTNSKLARITLQRNETLSRAAVSQQEVDELRAKVETSQSLIQAADADIAAGEATVKRMKELQSFSKIFAPFAGTITARNIELGRLVTSGNGNAQSLFRLANTETLRVFVNVPQMYAPGIQPGQNVELVVREMPGQSFRGVVKRTARAIDPATRTLLTEVQVPNPLHRLLPGAYVQVRIEVKREHPPLLVPASALIFNASGTQIALVNPENRVHLQPVVVEGDFGTEVGLASGIRAQDRVIVHPGDSFSEGTLVQVHSEK
jgi:RND family efflux transporter MFP subunit